MPSIPKKVRDRIVVGVKKYQPIIQEKKAKDVHEADTSTLVTEMLKEIFGYDILNDVFKEHEIKGVQSRSCALFPGFWGCI
ncbi:MAG TPA: hypothetical protein VMV69_28800 [Pirellulales bacterium]|nr:hypothetical protein [Pirellulales bacterium]